MNSKFVTTIALVSMLMSIIPSHAGDQIWKCVKIDDSDNVKRALNSYDIIAIIKYNEEGKEILSSFLKGNKLDQQPIMTENCYKAHKLVDGESGVLYCMYFSNIAHTAKTSVQQTSKTVRLCWNKEPSKVPARAITGERRQRIDHSIPELYITIEDLKRYLAK